MRVDFRTGIVFPLILFALVAMTFLAFFLQSMSSGYATQVAHCDEVVRCHAIANSLKSRVLARIGSKPFAERFFAKAPFLENRSGFMGGDYDLFVTDSPGKYQQIDIWIMVKFARVRRQYFWRYQHSPTLLDAAGRTMLLLFAPVDPDEKSLPADYGQVTKDIEKILENRKTNRKISVEKSSGVKPLNKLDKILEVLDSPVRQGMDEGDPGVVNNEVPVLSPPPVLTENVIFAEDFSGTPPNRGPNGWDDHLVSDKSESLVQAPSGENVLNVKTQGGGGRAKGIPVTPVGDRLTYEADVMLQGNDTTVQMGFGAFRPLSDGFNGKLYNGIQFSLSPPGIKYAGARTDRPVSLGTCQANTWYKVKVEIDSKTQLARISINGQVVTENAPAAPVNREFNDTQDGIPQARVDRFDVVVRGGSGGSAKSALFDNIRITN